MLYLESDQDVANSLYRSIEVNSSKDETHFSLSLSLPSPPLSPKKDESFTCTQSMSSNSSAVPTPASPSSSGLDTARLLVQKVSRSFYGSKGSILIDQLIQKEAYRDEELGKRLGMPSRDVSKIAHRLVQDELVQVHRRSELKPGAPKASLRTYFYLDFSKSVDVIKWRMWKVQQTIDVKLRNVRTHLYSPTLHGLFVRNIYSPQ